MNFENSETVIASAMTEPLIVNDDDRKTMEWIYGNSKESNYYTVQLSDCDIHYLLEHLLLNLMNLMTGRNTLGGAWPDTDGEEQLQNWRLINLIYIKSGVYTKDEVRETFLEICEVHDVENDPDILGLFDRYIVSDKVIDL